MPGPAVNKPPGPVRLYPLQDAAAMSTFEPQPDSDPELDESRRNREPVSEPGAMDGSVFLGAPAAEGAADTEPGPFADLPASEAVPAGTVGKMPRPRPHLGMAILWCVGLLLVQLAISVVFAVGAVAILVLAGRPTTKVAELNEELTAILVPTGTATTVLFGVAACLLTFGKRMGRRIGWRLPKPAHLLLVILSVLPLAVLTGEVANWASHFLPTFQLEDLMAFGRQAWPLVFIAACLLPGVGEEIFFRGFLGRGLVARHGLVPGVFLTSLLFGLVHMEPIQVVGAFVLGLAIHYVYLTTSSLLASVVLHTLNNALAFASFRWSEVFPVPGISAASENEILHTPPLLLGAAALAIVPILLVLFQSRTRWVLTDGRYWSPGYVTGESPDPEQNATAVTGRITLGQWLVVLLTSAVLVACLLKAHQDYLAAS